MAKKTVKKTAVAPEEIVAEADTIEVPVTVKVARRVRLSKNYGEDTDEDTEEDEEILEVRPFVTTPARASARVGITMSRSYQSVSVTVEYSVPDYKERIVEAGDEAYELAKQHLVREMPDMRALLDAVKEATR